ncbi:MAG TPA: carboxylesterase family protein [Gammaproteobacteria bacterium]
MRRRSIAVGIRAGIFARCSAFGRVPWRLLASLVGLAVAAPTSAELDTPIRLDAGLLGPPAEVRDGVQVFKGIPFAAPPVGELRWRAPQPVPAWTGVRPADRFGDVCIQPPGQGRLNIAVLPDSPPMSEDCLYLNVWTPADGPGERLPVMVYFFGGAFTEGAGSVPLYDGTALARKGAVVVTMNYRLGAFGFFAHPALSAESEHGASGNYGLMDMLASLRWVQRNIAAFGGDPGNVTVFGQSAGAMAIAALVASPRAEGLFQRAISQSGAWMGLGPAPAMRTRASAEEAGRSAAAAAGLTTAAELRALAADEVAQKLRGAGMIVDGWVIPEDPSAVFAAGRQNAVDVLVGSNKDEASFLPGATVAQFEEQARMRWGDLAEEYLALYPHATDAEAARSAAESFSDGTFWHMRLYADYQLARGRRAWLYYFTQNPPAPDGQPPFPAAHAAEVPYVFANLGELPLFPDRSNRELAARSAPDRALAERMSSYWVNFARSGDPNGDALPRWQPHREGDGSRAIVLDAEPAAERLPDARRLELYDRLYARMRGAE